MLDSSKRSSLGRAALVVFAAFALATAAVSPVSAQEKASVRLKWVAQAQFAVQRHAHEDPVHDRDTRGLGRRENAAIDAADHQHHQQGNRPELG